MFTDFVNFIRDKGVVGLAVGIVTGGAVTKTVGSIVDNILSPLLAAITGATDNLNNLAYTVPLTKITFKYGAVLTSLVNMVVILFVVYLLFVKSPLNKLSKK
jgi:large conductance mechanosensitive channel